MVTAQVASILVQAKARGAQNRSVCAIREALSTTATLAWGKREVTWVVTTNVTTQVDSL